ncbi:hypothetical protein BGZ58_004560, partial [Dissophora ornata]
MLEVFNRVDTSPSVCVNGPFANPKYPCHFGNANTFGTKAKESHLQLNNNARSNSMTSFQIVLGYGNGDTFPIAQEMAAWSDKNY